VLKSARQCRDTERKALATSGTIVPSVFWRMKTKGRRGPKSPHRVVRFNKAWKNACAAARCPGRIPHAFRRTAVRSFVRAGIPERVAMGLTGHKTRSVFERYNIVSEGDLKDAARRLDAITTSAPLRAAR
jgi:integrase